PATIGFAAWRPASVPNNPLSSLWEIYVRRPTKPLTRGTSLNSRRRKTSPRRARPPQCGCGVGGPPAPLRVVGGAELADRPPQCGWSAVRNWWSARLSAGGRRCGDGGLLASVRLRNWWSARFSAGAELVDRSLQCGWSAVR